MHCFSSYFCIRNRRKSLRKSKKSEVKQENKKSYETKNHCKEGTARAGECQDPAEDNDERLCAGCGRRGLYVLQCAGIAGGLFHSHRYETPEGDDEKGNQGFGQRSERRKFIEEASGRGQ